MELEGKSFDERTIYQIEINGQLQDRWAQWLNGMIIKVQENSHNTTLLITVPDQAALRGILNKLWDLNLDLLSIHQVDRNLNLNIE
jgi:hypothetical protein